MYTFICMIARNQINGIKNDIHYIFVMIHMSTHSVKYISIIELEYQVRPVPANLSVVTFKEIFCEAKYPHSQTGLTRATCKSLGGSLSLNSIQIKTNSGNAHYNDQYSKESLVLKSLKKSQISKKYLIKNSF